MLNRLRIASDEGIALVLVVIVLAIVSIAAASAIFYTSGSQQNAYYTKSGTTAYTLAQGGLSNALAQLTTHYYDNNGQPVDNVTTLPSQVAWAPSGSQQSSSSTAGCTSTSTCMSWSALLECPSGTTCSAGAPSITLSGTEKAAWHISGIGKVPNPTGTGYRTRTITVDVPVNQIPGPVQTPDIFKGIYSGYGPSSTCDMTMGQGVTFVSPVWVKGNLCIQQTAAVNSPGTLSVGGWLQTSQSGKVGSSSAPISSLGVVGACNGSQASTPVCAGTLTKPNGKNYFTDGSSIYTTTVATTPYFPAPPSVDWNARQTEATGWSCTGGKSLASATFDLAGANYTCTTPAGSLTWDGTTLAIKGNVYVSGNLITQSNADFLYTGIGSIYAGGTVTFGNNSAICVGSVSNHACPSGPNWDVADNFMLILGKGLVSGANFNFEGGLYSDANINFSSGQTGINGPLVTPLQIFPGQQASSGFPNIQSLFSGAPDAPLPYWTLGTPINGTY